MVNKVNNWKNDFFSFQEDNREADAHQLKMLNFPKKFYKYRKLNKFTFDSLLASEVYLEKSNNQNDPYDACYSVDFMEVARNQYRDPNFWAEVETRIKKNIHQKDIEKILQSKNPLHSYIKFTQRFGLNIGVNSDVVLSKKINEWHGLVEDQRNKIRLTSFTTKNDCMLMWAHYGELHKGICIEYDFGNETLIQEKMQPVQYKTKQYDITHKILPDFSPNDISLGTYIAALSKAKAWAYEEEWRLINNTGSSFQKVPKPTAIYVGTYFNNNTNAKQKKVKSVGKKLGIPIYKMNIHHTKFIVEPISL